MPSASSHSNVVPSGDHVGLGNRPRERPGPIVHRGVGATVKPPVVEISMVPAVGSLVLLDVERRATASRSSVRATSPSPTNTPFEVVTGSSWGSRYQATGGAPIVAV